MKGNGILDYVIVAGLLLMCLTGIVVSLITVFGLPLLAGGGSELQSIDSLDKSNSFTMTILDSISGPVTPVDSPTYLRILVKTPPLQRGDQLSIITNDGNKALSQTDCLAEMTADESYVGATQIECNASVPYNYATSNTVEFRALLEPPRGSSYSTDTAAVAYDWSGYEASVWSFGLVMLLAIGAGLLFVVVPLSAGMYYLATKEKHHIIYEGEYTLGSLLNPFKNVKNPSEFLQAFIASPLFWALELVGILLIIIYLAMAANAIKSSEAMLAFLISGGIAFFTPFLWVAIWWVADYKEREPLRIIVSLFLWGCVTCLMAIGINTIMDSIFLSIGIGALTAALVAPMVEEFFKGTGLVLFSLHHEFNGVNDGLVYGFTIGMGFAFIENWLYLLGNPMGANIGSWLFLFFIRSIMFSAMHGVYTAMTGALIGLLKEKAWPQIPLFIFTLLPAMFFHSVHNSGELVGQLLGPGSALAYCCLIMPLFDYGGLVLLAVLMVGWLALVKK